MRKEVEMMDGQVNLICDTIGHGKTVLEIGCYAGKLTTRLAENNNVIAVDPFISNYDERDFTYNEDMENVYKIFYDRIKDKPNIQHYMMTSYRFLEKITDKFSKHEIDIDALVIDGDHSEKGIEIDRRFIDFIKPGGIIALHDNSVLFPAIKMFVDTEMINDGRYEKIGEDDSLIIFRKKW